MPVTCFGGFNRAGYISGYQSFAGHNGPPRSANIVHRLSGPRDDHSLEGLENFGCDLSRAIEQQEISMNRFKACHCCGLVQDLPDVAESKRLVCCRCETPIQKNVVANHSATRTAAAALGAFCLFWPAVLLPILQIEKLGMKSQSSIVSGIIELFQHGSYFVGSVVFVFSIVFPLTKIVLLFELSCLEILRQRHKAFTLRLMEHLGKWSMMDVMLLAFMVMLVKLGDMVEFHFGPAIVAFVGCVAMSMVASICFDPHAIWEDEPLSDG